MWETQQLPLGLPHVKESIPFDAMAISFPGNTCLRSYSLYVPDSSALTMVVLSHQDFNLKGLQVGSWKL